ncbi:MAG TPA: sensor histidine kinase [Solirubrobacteraceae bacterium]|jgi:two-component system sensor histidine kinase DesK|nr:sensor histidine kinase [Solirubrobacteraceae bacterium]
MANATKLVTESCRESQPFDPTGMFMPGAVPRTAAEWRRKRIAINVSFLWLLFPILDLAGKHPSPLRAGCVAVAVVAFVLIYNRIPRGRPASEPLRRVAPALAALATIAMTLTLADRSSWTLLFIFAAISGAMRLGKRDAAAWIALCTVFTAVGNVVDATDVGSTISLSATTLAIGFMMLAFRRLMVLNHDLLTAREEVARLAVSEERLRFARDLHDLLGHGLTVISVKAELAERLLTRDLDEAAEHIADIKQVARNALSEVREAVGDYRKPTLANELSGARMALQAAGIEAELAGTDVTLDPEVEAVLAWAVREGTTNVIRHSGARSCRIEVHPGLAAVSAEVVDDGRAVACDANGDGDGAARGSGLIGLRERAERLAGRLEAGPAPDGGFRLWVTLPVRGPLT